MIEKNSLASRSENCDAPSAFPEGGFAKGGLAGLVGICRLRRGFLFPEGRIALKIAAGAVGWLVGVSDLGAQAVG